MQNCRHFRKFPQVRLYLYKQPLLVAAVCGAQVEPRWSLAKLTTMTFYYIPEAQKELVLTMYLRGMTVGDIMDATGMG